MKIINKKYLSWNIIELLVFSLVIQIEDFDIKPKAIVGLPRGGLIPAVMLAHQLDIPLYDSIGVGLAMMSRAEFEPFELLVVDDIADTGKTLEKYQQHQIAVLHWKKGVSTVNPHHVGRVVTDDEWIVYPWELSQAPAIQDYKR